MTQSSTAKWGLFGLNIGIAPRAPDSTHRLFASRSPRPVPQTSSIPNAAHTVVPGNILFNQAHGPESNSRRQLVVFRRISRARGRALADARRRCAANEADVGPTRLGAVTVLDADASGKNSDVYRFSSSGLGKESGRIEAVRPVRRTACCCDVDARRSEVPAGVDPRLAQDSSPVHITLLCAANTCRRPF